jgi:uncharacterized protein
MIYINIQQTVFEIIKAYPEYKQVLIEAGFSKLADSGMLNTMGKIMTLEKGMMLRNIAIDDLERVSNTYHFTLFNEKIDKHL